MKAVILAGGFATRLRPLSCSRPKILFPIVNKPLLQWIFERLASSNTSEVIMAVSYRTKVLMKQHRIPRCGLEITYSVDPLKKPLGTGGPVKKAEKLIGHDEPFLVLNEDIFAEIDYAKVLQAHGKNDDAVATIVLHRVEDPSRYGVAELTEDNRIKRFIEKPQAGTAPTNLINAGVYVLSPEIFQYIPERRAVSLEREIFPKLAERGLLYGYNFDGIWMDIGKPKDYLEINWKMLDLLPDQQKSRVSDKVEIKKPAAIDIKVSVGKGSVIGPHTVVGRNVTLGNKVYVQRSVVFPETVISDSSSIDGAIIGEDVIIGKGAKIGKGCIIGDHARIGDNVTLANGVSVCPAVEVSKSVLTPRNIC